MIEDFDEAVGSYSEDLKCKFLAWIADGFGVLYLYLPKNNTADSRGVVKVGKTILPSVQEIRVVVGGRYDCVYEMDGKSYLFRDMRNRSSHYVSPN